MKENCFVVEPSIAIIIIKDDGFRAYGNTVYTKGLDSGQVLMFAHLDSINVQPNQRLEKGDIVGEIGSTGYCSSGAHLHTSLFSKDETSYYARNTIDPKEYYIKYGLPCRTIMTNPYGSKHFNDKAQDKNGDQSLKAHEGNDFSSYRLRV